MLARSAVEKDVLPYVPFGKVNAISALLIWKHLDCWSEIGVRNALTALSDRRDIERERELIPGGYRWVYWREQ